MTLYHCPDCDRIHDDPFEAAFGLFAQCVDCALDEVRREFRPLAGEYASAA